MKLPPRARHRLVWVADDFGFSGPVNEGIALAHRQGLVRAASVLATGAAFEGAIRLAREMPGLDVGAHLAAVEQKALLPPERLPGLASPDGALPSGYPAFLARYVTGRIRVSTVEAEWEAQLGRLRDSGLAVVHLDSHQHLHVLPGLFEAALRLGRRFGIRAVRTPDDVVRGRVAPLRALALSALFSLGRKARELARRQGFVTADGTLGIGEAGRVTAARIRAWLPFLMMRGPGVWELVSHPGLGEVAGSSAGAWGYRWAEELEAARDLELAEELRAAGVDAVGWRDLAEPSRRP